MSNDGIDEVLAERQKTHGDWMANARIAQAMKGVWRQEEGWKRLSVGQREALEMIAAKVGRILSGDPNHVDHWVDIAGYAALVAKQLDGDGKRSAAEPKEEPEAKAKAEPRIGAEVAAKNAPYDNAKVFMWRHCYREGVLAVYWYDGNFWEWNGRCYAKKKMDDIEKDVWTFLDDARSSQSQGRFLPTPSNVGDLIKGLKALVAIPFDPPCWTDGRPAGNMLVFRNGVVDIDSGEIVKPTPKLWIHHELGFDYDPGARCPLWERWLGEVFAGDAETRECIEEQLGLGMTNEVKFQKGFLWIGKKGREGKGTLAFILERLCGSGAYASLSFHTWLKGEYSSEVLIGKKVGVFPDVRFKDGKWYGQNYDPGGIDHVSKEMVLKISGADNVTITRKWQSVAWQGVLPIKLFLISNKIPNLNDPILVSRFVMIAFNVSFADRVDVGMRDKLAVEPLEPLIRSPCPSPLSHNEIPTTTVSHSS